MAHDKRTAEALEASIRHWEENVAAEIPQQAGTSADDCALCDEFHPENSDEKGCCEGCPVFKRTGQKWCAGTPFHEAHHALNSWLRKGGSPKVWKRAAQKELDFLVSLRDPEASS